MPSGNRNYQSLHTWVALALDVSVYCVGGVAAMTIAILGYLFHVCVRGEIVRCARVLLKEISEGAGVATLLEISCFEILW